MGAKNKEAIKAYWEENIEGFSGFYDTQSEETIHAPRAFSSLYKKFIFPIEKKYMKFRYDFVCDYIEKNVKNGMQVADIGCGSGVFTKRMISKGATVYAIDYAQNAIDLTKRNLTKDEIKSVELMCLDILQQNIPRVDLAISIGVLPYIDNADNYFNNIVPFTDLFLFNYLAKNSPVNCIRRAISLLDVRNYSYHNPAEIKNKLNIRGFKITNQQKLATGFILESEKIK